MNHKCSKNLLRGSLASRMCIMEAGRKYMSSWSVPSGVGTSPKSRRKESVVQHGSLSLLKDCTLSFVGTLVKGEWGSSLCNSSTACVRIKLYSIASSAALQNRQIRCTWNWLVSDFLWVGKDLTLQGDVFWTSFACGTVHWSPSWACKTSVTAAFTTSMMSICMLSFRILSSRQVTSAKFS